LSVRVFVSYRRSDVGGNAGRLCDALDNRLGRDMVFHDVSAVAAGRDFTVEIDAALASSDAVLAVIGPGWLSATTPDGRPRLVDPDDFVRRELVAALRTDTPVVPVLVGGASLPSADQLPDELAGLAQRQAVVIRDEAFTAMSSSCSSPYAVNSPEPGRRHIASSLLAWSSPSSSD
jgi:hypothetical protein